MLHLKVQRFDQTCLFTLTWGQGQQLAAGLFYPPSLARLYLDWQRSYQSFYKSGQRARAEDQGSIAPPPIDWRARLAQDEVRLLNQFHYWLRSAELFEIRAQIARSASDQAIGQSVRLLLTCDRPELERLPWETWELGAELGAAHLQIARGPLTIRAAPAMLPLARRWSRARILVILGDDTGLDVQGDRAAVAALRPLAALRFVGLPSGTDPATLRQEICQAIADPAGWDALLFAGHSNELELLGGEIGIAPGQTLSFKDLEPYLLQAQQQGLQFVLFNSCNGLDLARHCIDLGIGQVAAMREPIHNDAAHHFLRRFLQELAQFRDAETCVALAAQSLKVEHHLTLPSAYLIPSLFCHPQATSFRLRPRPNWRSRLGQLAPRRWEAVAIAVLTATSLWLPAQNWLLQQRVLVQALYRQETGQLPTDPPPVLLVAIDEDSVQRGDLLPPRPMNQAYLADLVAELSERGAQVIGLDYLLSRPPAASDAAAQARQEVLRRRLEQAVARKTNLVLATVYQPAAGTWQDPLPAIADPRWSLRGSIHLFDGYAPLVPPQMTPQRRLPLSYLLALAAQPELEPPQLDSREDRFAQLSTQLEAHATSQRDSLALSYFSQRSQLQPFTYASYRFGQMWLHPILDGSLPPQQVYEWLPAWQLLEGQATSNLANQVVLIAPGGYGEAGIAGYNQDALEPPPALRYWFARQGWFRTQMVGGEVHAYAIHHYLNRHFVLPIPQVWVLAIAALLGKALSQFAPQRRTGWLLLVGIGLYGLLSLQLYVSAQLLLPWLLPAIALGLFALPCLRSQR